jgi:hypothetical protein
MANVIQFLESMGRNGTMNRLSQAGYATAISGSGLDATAQNALIDRNPQALAALLGARDQMRCFIYTSE